MKFQKGDIVVIPVPFTDNQAFKKRPAVVISNNDVHDTGDVMIVQITSHLRDDKLSFPLNPTDTTVVLPKSSVVRIHKIFVLGSHLIVKKVSALKPTAYSRLIEEIGKIIS
jgi:mRNA interferase MazF